MTRRTCARWRLWNGTTGRLANRALMLGLLFAWGGLRPAYAASDIVLYTSDVSAASGNWAQSGTPTGAGGLKMVSADYGWSTPTAALASPGDYYEATFSAPASTPYHVWLRLRGVNDSKYNESVWVQFSDSLTQGGSSVYRIGTTGGLLVNLENCSGCGVSAWGWQDKAYWLSQSSIVQFASSGSHTIRIQTREDGVQIDQVVLSPSTYLYSAPGSVTNDSTVLPESSGSASASGGSSGSGSGSGGSGSGYAGGPYGGSAASIPGRISAANFDSGGSGVAYYDTTPGNNGGAYRQTDVDIESSSEGGQDVGWIAGGEWVNYTVNVSSSGSYTTQLRVASPNGGGSLHIGFNGSGVWTSVSIPATGGWQNWTTVDVPMSLSAGVQQMTLLFETSGFNLEYVDVTSGSAVSTASSGGSSGGSTGGSSGSGSGSGGALTAIAWNIQVNDWGPGHAAGAMDYAVGVGPMPQVVIIEEAHASQYDTYINELQNRTGVTWRGSFQQHCAPGGWNGSSCNSYDEEGVAVFSSLPVVGSSGIILPYADQWHSGRGVARLAVSMNGTTVQVFAVHLQVDSSARYSSMAYLKSWTSNFSAPQIAGGDFNADPDQIDTTAGMLPNFADSWQAVGSGPGYTAFVGSPSMKLDYLFGDGAGKAQPAWTYVVTGTGGFSDHYPVMTQFNIRP